MDLLVQLLYSDRACILALRFEHPAVPQHVIERNQPTPPNQLQSQLVIGIVLRLFCVQESKIECSRRPFSYQVLKRFNSLTADRSSAPRPLPSNSAWPRT